ncbi:hypothetical protein BJX99DRAFT_226699 [Aspergillus californicus]
MGPISLTCMDCEMCMDGKDAYCSNAENTAPNNTTRRVLYPQLSPRLILLTWCVRLCIQAKLTSQAAEEVSRSPSNNARPTTESV